jgi:hypothetical protein
MIPMITINFISVDMLVDKYKIERSDAVHISLQSGGAYVSIMNDKIRAASARICSSVNLDSIPNGYVIGIYTDIFSRDIFSEEEIASVIAHEEGHIVLGHVDAAFALNEKDMDTLDKPKVHLDMAQELEADKYAARKIGAAHVLSAMLKIPTAMADFVIREGIYRSREEIEAFLKENFNTLHAPRIIALERMISSGE